MLHTFMYLQYNKSAALRDHYGDYGSWVCDQIVVRASLVIPFKNKQEPTKVNLLPQDVLLA